MNLSVVALQKPAPALRPDDERALHEAASSSFTTTTRLHYRRGPPSKVARQVGLAKSEPSEPVGGYVSQFSDSAIIAL